MEEFTAPSGSKDHERWERRSEDSESDRPTGLRDRDRRMNLDRGALLAIIGILLVLSALLVSPYIQFVLGAVLLGFILRPLQIRLEPRIGRTPAAFGLVMLSVFAVVLPLLLTVAFVVSTGIGYVRRLEQQELDFATLEEPIATYTGQAVDLESIVRSSGEAVGGTAFGSAVTALETTVHVVIGLGLLTFLLFFFIRDADRFLAWLMDVSPLRSGVTEELLERVSNITRAVLIGHVLVAVIQGVIAGVGLTLVGIPNAVFWTFVMVLLALIPLIGTFAVWAPASAYLVATGNTTPAVALFVYGVFVVGISDEYLRPVLVNRYAKLGPSVIIVGVLGGLTVFGFMGIFVGPIIVGSLKAAVEVYNDYYGRSTNELT